MDLLLLGVDDRHGSTRGGRRLAAAPAAAQLVELDPAVAALAQSASPVTVHRWLTAHAHPAVIARYVAVARAADKVNTGGTLTYDRDKARARRSAMWIDVADEKERDRIVARISAAARGEAGKSGTLSEPDRTVMTVARFAHRTVSQRRRKAETPAEAGVYWRRLRDLNPRWA